MCMCFYKYHILCFMQILMNVLIHCYWCALELMGVTTLRAAMSASAQLALNGMELSALVSTSRVTCMHGVVNEQV